MLFSSFQKLFQFMLFAIVAIKEIIHSHLVKYNEYSYADHLFKQIDTENVFEIVCHFKNKKVCGIRAVRRACGAVVSVVACFAAFCENYNLITMLYAKLQIFRENVISK